jgi:precorrin-3B synthase
MARGWCPGVFTPMEAADGWLVRVKPRLGRLGADTARRIAEAAARHGNGRIELTSRANLQVRGLTPATVPLFAAAMVACGAADADPAVERRRNIIVSPLAGDDPAITGRPEHVAAALERALAASDLTLPAKFGFAVDGGGVLPLGDTGADVVIATHADHCEVWAAGAAHAMVCDADAAPAMALALARAFLDRGGTRRMRDLIAAVGELPVRGATRPVLARGGIARLAAPPPRPPMPAAALIAAAELARRGGDGTLRVTPWRRLLIGGAGRAMPRVAA